MLWAGIVLPQLALDGALRHQYGSATGTADPPSPPVASLVRSPSNTAHWLALVAAWAYRYSSVVCLEGEDAVVLEIAASLGLFGPWPHFRERLTEDLAALGFTHRIALAPTPLAACVLAGAGRMPAVTQLMALPTALATVPVAAARLPGDPVADLSRMGVQTLGQLFILPRAGLARRFGPALPLYLERLYGECADPGRRYEPPDFFNAGIEFNYGLNHHTALLFPLRRMLGDLCAWLGRRDGGVQRFELHLMHTGKRVTTLSIGLLAPSRDPAHLLELCRARLEQIRLPAPIQELQLLARELPPFKPVTPDLFRQPAGDGMSWNGLRERLRARLGETALFQLRPQADARPERSCEAVPELAREPDPVPLARRPAWLLPAPKPWQGAVREILAGPERIESGWWDGQDVRRDYYVIETSLGQRAWVFREAGDTPGRWMLHGWFA